MIPYNFRPKLLENHTLHSGTYLYSPYMAIPPATLRVPKMVLQSCHPDSTSCIPRIFSIPNLAPHCRKLLSNRNKVPPPYGSCFCLRIRKLKLVILARPRSGTALSFVLFTRKTIFCRYERYIGHYLKVASLPSHCRTYRNVEIYCLPLAHFLVHSYHC